MGYEKMFTITKISQENGNLVAGYKEKLASVGIKTELTNQECLEFRKTHDCAECKSSDACKFISSALIEATRIMLAGLHPMLRVEVRVRVEPSEVYNRANTK